MAKNKSKRADAAQQPTPPTHDEMEEESDVEIIVDEQPEKDETELELENLVFGDSAGFREGLKGFALDEQEDGEGEEHEEASLTDGLEGLDDADVGQAPLEAQ